MKMGHINIVFLLLFMFFGFVVSNPLVGEPHYCRREGARVQVASTLLGMDPCLTCYCKNHMVQCYPPTCASVEGCYRLKPRQSPQCCPTCLGCKYGNKEISHGQWWSDQCHSYECQAGVLTTSDTQCHVPCSNPLPPTDGQCCPKCKGCWLEGDHISEGETASPRLDPCVKCSCNNGELICSKRSCPVLSCPPNRAVLDTDGCCPVCNGSREIFIPPGGRCFLGRYLYQTGDNRTFDDCTSCTCNMGYLTCKRKTCTPLNCPSQYRRKKEGDCCASCVYPLQSQMCLYGGVHREHGDIWYLDKCTSCNCTHGRVTCQVDHCEYLTKDCPAGYSKKKSEDLCCPQCIEDPGVCVVYGRPHYKTFDNHFLDFQGECRYDLAKDCSGKKMFSVRVNNDARYSPQFPWTRSVLVKFKNGLRNIKVSLSHKLRTKVDQRRIKLPYEDEDLNITRSGFLLTMKTEIGIQISWDGASYIEVKLDSKWRNQTCGLCGNFNKNATDDRTTKKGEMAPDDETMATSWQSGKTKSCLERLKRLKQKYQDSNHGNQIRTQRLTCVNSRKESIQRCTVLNGTHFDSCRREISTENFYRSCLLDLCGCPSSHMCECDSVVAYARECERANVDISGWKTATKCGGLECPYGSMYMECAPACKPSCRNQTPNPNCHMRRCKPGCYCPPPTVLHRGTCIFPQNCPTKKKRKRKSKRKLLN